MITQKMIDANRDILTDEGWWECCIDDAKAKLLKQGIEVTDVYFTLAYTQGDGACFGYAEVGDEKLFFREHFSKAEYPWIAKLLDDDLAFNFSCDHKGSRYCHSNSVWFDLNHDTFSCNVYDQQDELACEVAEIWDKHLEDEIESFQEDCEAIFKGYMDDIYQALQDEYEYLTSDDVIKQYLEEMEEVA